VSIVAYILNTCPFKILEWVTPKRVWSHKHVC